VPDGATHFKCAPPIRDEANRAALWSGLGDGTIDFIVTDHSPCTPALKQAERGDFHEAWGGISSLQLGLGSVWTEARARGFDVPRLVEWMAERPARFAGLGTRKGRLAPGYDADIAIWSPEATFEVTPEMLQFRHKQTPYAGRTLCGVVRQTWLGGGIVYDARGIDDVPRGRPLLRRDPRGGSTT
jgi:allantoinase